MNETETQQPSSETETSTSPEITGNVSKAKSSPWKGLLMAGVVVLIIILGVLYLLEKEGRSSTHIFASLIEQQEANVVVATVNGNDIINAKLQTNIEQFSQVAAAQGVNVSDPLVQADIRDQALEVLINTELLKQEAASRGIAVSDDEVETRLSEIKDELGGEDVLAERITALGIEEEQLFSDIRDELIIQQLLDQVFEVAAIEVTEEEITSVYEDAGGEEAGLPVLEEVRDQVEAQIKASKEQEAIDEFLNGLRSEANIETEESA